MRKLFPILLILALLMAACGGSGGTSEEASPSSEDGQVAEVAEGTLRGADPNSIAVVTTLAGSGEQGSQDGTGTEATFTQPADVAMGPDGNIYAVSFRGRRITRITPDGQVTTLAASPASGDKDGPAGDARFSELRSLAVAEDGTIYFADWTNKKLKKLTPDGQISTVAETGFLETMIWDGQGNMLAPAGSFREYIMRITPQGETSVFAGQRANAGSSDGTLETAKLSNMSGVAMDGAGNVYVTQAVSLRQKAGDQLIRTITTDGEVITIAGQRFQEGYQDGPGMDAIFDYPVALAAAPDGTLFVADSVSNCIRRVGPEPDYEVTTVAGACGESGDLVDGEGLDARFKNPQGLTLDADGNLYVADALNNAIRKIEFQ